MSKNEKFNEAPRTFDEAVAYAVTLLAIQFRQTTSPAMFFGYGRGLRGLSVQQIIEATDIALQRSKFFPAASELRTFANAGETPATERAVLAWAIVSQAISHVGGYRSVDFDCPVINATIRLMGGWARLCDVPIAEMPFRQKDFERLYASLMSQGISPDIAQPLPGLIEVDNSGNGHSVPPPFQRIATGLPPLPIAKRIAAAASEKPPNKAIESTAKSIGLPPPQTPEPKPSTKQSKPTEKPPVDIPGLDQLARKQQEMRERATRLKPKPKDTPDDAAA